MKFKVLKDFRQVMAKAEELNLIKCPIDGKNLSSDIFEEIFCDNLTYCPTNNKEMTGYIRSTPVWLKYSIYAIVVRPSLGISPLATDDIEGRFSELFNLSDYEATGEQDYEHLLLCYHDKDNFYIHSFWAEIKD